MSQSKLLPNIEGFWVQEIQQDLTFLPESDKQDEKQREKGKERYLLVELLGINSQDGKCKCKRPPTNNIQR